MNKPLIKLLIPHSIIRPCGRIKSSSTKFFKSSIKPLDYNCKNWNNLYHPILNENFAYSKFKISFVREYLRPCIAYAKETLDFSLDEFFLQNLLALLGGSPSPVDDVIITIIGSSSSLNWREREEYN